jgi:hypothetical protein
MLLRKKLAVLLATVMMFGVMGVSPALAHHDVGHVNQGHKLDDGADPDQGGGNDHIKTNRGGEND